MCIKCGLEIDKGRNGKVIYCAGCKPIYRTKYIPSPRVKLTKEEKKERSREYMRKKRNDPEWREQDMQKHRKYTPAEFAIFKASYKCLRCGVPTEYPRLLCDEHKAQAVKETSRRNSQLRRARHMNAPRGFTRSDWQRALEYFEWSCAYCGSSGDLHQDHFIPLSRGGGYTRDNIVPACSKCNSEEKRDTMPLDWLVMQDHGLVKYVEAIKFLEAR